MAVRFTPCPGCERHVKEGDGACPFCGASVPRPPAQAVVRGRMSRAALLAASAAGALALGGPLTGVSATEGCLGSPPGDLGTGSSTPLYGGTAVPAEGGPGDDGSALDGTASAQPFYGAAFPPGQGGGSKSGAGSSGASSGGGSGTGGSGAGSSGASTSGGSSGAGSSGEPSGDAGDAATTTSVDASDASAEEAGDAGHDGGHSFQPLYGGVAPAYGLVPKPE
jgi:hypothetical protein